MSLDAVLKRQISANAVTVQVRPATEHMAQ